MHLLALAGVVLGGWPLIAKTLAALAVAIHAIVRYPESAPERMEIAADGRWCVPTRGLEQLTLRHGTRFTPHWVLLRLAGRGGRLNLLLLADQLDRDAWAGLLAWLRRQHALREGTDHGATLRDLR